MSRADKISVVQADIGPHIRAPLLDGITGTNPTTGSPRSQSPMVRASSVAAALAVLPLPTKDDAPRVIRQFTSVFLVSRSGELWRVYDTGTPQGFDRHMPSPLADLPHRLFVALARTSQMRVHTFEPGESRDVEPADLQRQLESSVSSLGQ
jgi:hypothetical protein